MVRRLFSRRRFGLNLLTSGTLVPLLAACGGRTTPPQVAVAGQPQTMRSRALEAGAATLQGDAPLDAMNMYLDGFHFYADDMGRQVEAHHYCAQLNEEVFQCAIFDSNGRNARLIGIEYIVSERLFRQLPEDEKPLWHSHHHEVKSGQLVMPGVPALAEHEAMETLVTTYGKTWHTWQVDRGDQLPLGIPQLMMGFTGDGQLKPQLMQERDARFGISTAEKRREREDIPMLAVAPGANAWEDGDTVQLDRRVVPVRRMA